MSGAGTFSKAMVSDPAANTLCALSHRAPAASGPGPLTLAM